MSLEERKNKIFSLKKFLHFPENEYSGMKVYLNLADSERDRK